MVESSRSSEGLAWEGVSLGELAERLGTPLFIFSERRLKANCAKFRDALPGASFRYCGKTNNESGVLRVIAGEQFGALVSHEGELDLALDAGFAASSIAFQRPVLLAKEISYAIARGVRKIHIHRPDDVPLLAAAADRAGTTVELIVRVSHRTRTPLLKGAALRLGCTDEETRAVVDAIHRSPRLRFAGLSVYVGTQQLSAGTFRRAMERVLALGRPLRGEGPFEINLGGGVPAADTRRLTLATLWSRWRGSSQMSAIAPEALINSIARDWARLTSQDSDLPLVMEPGRALVADAAVMLTRVAAVQRNWIFVDASRNYFGEMPLLFTRPLKPVRPAKGRRRIYNISGSTLNTGDVIDLRRSFAGAIAAGDVLASFDAGAYSISRASRYAGLTPAVYLLASDGELHLIRRAETSADLSAPMNV